MDQYLIYWSRNLCNVIKEFPLCWTALAIALVIMATLFWFKETQILLKFCLVNAEMLMGS